MNNSRGTFAKRDVWRMLTIMLITNVYVSYVGIVDIRRHKRTRSGLVTRYALRNIRE